SSSIIRSLSASYPDSRQPLALIKALRRQYAIFWTTRSFREKMPNSTLGATKWRVLSITRLRRSKGLDIARKTVNYFISKSLSYGLIKNKGLNFVLQLGASGQCHAWMLLFVLEKL